MRNDRKVVDIIIKAIKIVLGIFVASLGTAVLFEVGWGSAPISTMTEGIHIFFQMSYGLSNLILNGVALLLMVIFARTLVSIGTIISLFLFGYMIDLGAYLIAPLGIHSYGFYLKIISLLIGVILSAVGIGYYIRQDLGIGAIDAQALILEQKLNINPTLSRWIVDGVLGVIGILLGGSWGVGTILTLAFNGPIIHFVRNYNSWN